MTEITRNGSTAARGLVSIQSRFNQIADETSSTGKKLTAWYQEHNIAIRDQNGQLRSFFEVGKDVSKIWNQLSGDERRYYLNTQAGANQTQNLSALMSNYSTAIEATTAAENSAGSATEENEKRMDSLEGILRRLSSAWENFSRKLVNSDVIKGVLKALAEGLELLSSDGGAFIAKSALIAASITSLGHAFGAIKGVEGSVSVLETIVGFFGKKASAIKGMFTGVAPAAQTAGEAMSGYTIKAGKALKQNQKFAKTSSTVAKNTVKMAGDTSRLGASFGLLGSNIGLAAAALGAYGAFKIGQTIYKEYQETHKAEKATKELTKSNKERLETTEEEAQQARDYLSELGKLEGVENKTAYQKRKMADLVKELNKIYPELNLQYDKNTDSLSSNSDELRDMIDEASKLSKMDAYEENAKDAEKAAKKTGKSLKKSKKDIQDYIETINDSTSRAARRAASENLQKAVKQYQTDFKESAKQWRESIKYYNKAFLMTDDWTNLVEQYESLGKEIPESVIKGINKGIYEAPDTVEGMESLVKWDQLISDYEHIFGKTIPATIQKALADGIYDMPTTTYELEDLIKFETSREGLEALGVDLSDSFIKGFQSQGSGIRQKFNELLTNILKVDPKKASEIFAYQDWGFDTMFNDLQADAEGRPISLKVQLSSTDDVKSRINTIRKELGNLEEGQDITIGVKDEATGEIQAITITAEAFENEYFAKMSAEDQASSIIKYTQAVANGYKGDYIAWLNAEAASAQTGIDAVTAAVKAFADNDWTTTVDADTTLAQANLEAINYQANLIPPVKQIGIKVSGVAQALSDIASAAKAAAGVGVKSKHAKGTRNAPEGFSEVNEQGWEFIRDRKSGQLRVAGGGERTVTYLNKGDIVYPHQESLRMLADKDNISIGQHKDGSLNWRQQRQIESWMSHQRRGRQTFNQTWQNLLSYQRQGIIDEDDYVRYIRDASEADIEWRMELYKRNKATYSEMTALIQSHFNSGYMLAENYYKALEDLAKEAKDKEEDRLKSLKSQQEDAYDLAKLYVRQQIDLIDKENAAQEEQNELLELQNQLTEARNKKTRVYREGVGFVYESDANAIKEATDALKEYNTEKEKEAKKKPWQDILDLFDQQETLRDIKELENKLGQTTSQLFGGMGTNLTAWTEWVKTNLSTTLGLENILEELGNVEGLKWITEYLNSSMQVDQSKIQAAINKNKFASGTLSAPGGISRVGEHGYELAMLGAGDAVLPHTVSKNLMEIGKYSAVEWKKMLRDSDNATVNQYSFDKLVLPSVKSADDFIRELNKLPNQGIQKVGSRR